MIIKLLTLLFNTLIGKLPEDTKKELEGKFTSLITEVVKAGAKGAVEGLKKQ